LSTETADLSATGARFHAAPRWGIGAAVNVLIDFPEDRRLVAFKGSVAWRRDDELGVEFTATTPEQRYLLQSAVRGGGDERLPGWWRGTGSDGGAEG
jgi:hypothetical protein